MKAQTLNTDKWPRTANMSRWARLLGLVAVALRGRGIFIEGDLVVPAAAVMAAEASETSSTTEEPVQRKHEAKR